MQLCRHCMYWNISKNSNTVSQKHFTLQGDADSMCLICHNDLSKGIGGTTELQCSHSFHKEVTHTHPPTHRYQKDWNTCFGCCWCVLSNGKSSWAFCLSPQCIQEWLWRKQFCPTCNLQVSMHLPIFLSSTRVKVPWKPAVSFAQCDVSEAKVTLHSNETNTLMQLINNFMCYKRFVKAENWRCLVFRSVTVTKI